MNWRTVVLALLMAAVPVAAAQKPAAQKPKQTKATKQAAESNCITCHTQRTPGVVKDWRESRHAANGLGCETCHGDAHQSAADVAKVNIPTPETCGNCHSQQHDQFIKGKHAKGWLAMNAMPTIHYQPMQMIEGQQGCGGCHKIGTKTEAEIKGLSKASGGFGVASCDSCHTRHTFSKKEAQQPESCQTCHMGFDHPQWEMWSGSKHGVRSGLKRSGVLSPNAQAPTCQTCHMQNGNHDVHTGWGFLAVRLPMPEDQQWAADRVMILQALGVLDLDGKPTARLDAVKAADLARLDQETFDKYRKEMLDTCNQCHSGNFARVQLENGDKMIKEVDHLMAEGIREVAALYKEGVLAKPKTYAAAFPDLLTFHDAPTVIEQKLFVMFLEHRMRAFQGVFHANPDYALWYGWSEMQRDLTEIRELAAHARRDHKEGKPAAMAQPIPLPSHDGAALLSAHSK